MIEMASRLAAQTLPGGNGLLFFQRNLLPEKKDVVVMVAREGTVHLPEEIGEVEWRIPVVRHIKLAIRIGLMNPVFINSESLK